MVTVARWSLNSSSFTVVPPGSIQRYSQQTDRRSVLRIADRLSVCKEDGMNRKAERGQATRDQFVAIATRLFAEHGYEGTSIEAVLTEASVSRGALYHHFKGKEALFEAVFEAVETDIGQRLQASAPPGASPEELLRAGCLAWVRMAVDPVVRQVV